MVFHPFGMVGFNPNTFPSWARLRDLWCSYIASLVKLKCVDCASSRPIPYIPNVRGWRCFLQTSFLTRRCRDPCRRPYQPAVVQSIESCVRVRGQGMKGILSRALCSTLFDFLLRLKVVETWLHFFALSWPHGQSKLTSFAKHIDGIIELWKQLYRHKIYQSPRSFHGGHLWE